MPRAKLETILGEIHDKMRWEYKQDNEHGAVRREQFSDVLLGAFIVESEQTVRTKWNALTKSRFVSSYDRHNEMAFFDIGEVRKYLKEHHVTYFTPEDVRESESERVKKFEVVQ